MKISIITVVYNNKSTIIDAIESVHSQSYKNFELIVVDGASTDGTTELLHENTSKIARLISEPDKGIYDAMNKGIRSASGDIIGILNSDDIYYSNKVFQLVLDSFTSDSSLEAVYGNLVYVKRKDTEKIVRRWVSTPYTPGFFRRGHVPPHPTLFVKADAYKKIGLFDLQYKLAADYEFMLRAFEKYNLKSGYLDAYLIKMRLGGATNKSFKNIFHGNKEILSAWKNNGLIPPFTLMFSRFLKRIIQFIR
jgi:glycosyltransferase involved in cell wall biosynthesis